MSSIVATFRKSLARHGVFGTVRLSILNVWWFVLDRVSPHRRRIAQEERDFDAQMGVDTSRILQKEDLAVDSSLREFGTYHGPTPAGPLKAIFKSLAIDHSRFIFLDLGSGLGRAVFGAAQFPFKKIIGVEFARNLHDDAVRNLDRVDRAKLRCKDIELICLDASQYKFPDEPLVVYLANPFSAEVMTGVVDNLGRSIAAKPRDLYVVLYNPVCDPVFAALPWLQKIQEGYQTIYRNKL